MDLDTLPTHELKDLDEHFRAVIKKILPDLYNFKLQYHSGKIANIDFYFEDDPRRDEPGYTGYGMTEFILGSPTSDALMTITMLLGYALGLKCDESGDAVS
jgi:hypothetical protein